MESGNKAVLEGVFAVAKPALVSSADVLQKLQVTFADCRMFAPLLKSQPQRPSKSDDQVFKMGHGGTLDPLASGVLIVGIGRGTKHLQKYLACTKTYETVVLFGASTDTYDCTGTVAERADYEHVTQALVESQLKRFRGKIMQAPPIYSALKINGVKACEYARQGKELPRELEEREMFVDECTLLEWYEGGRHSFNHLEDEGLTQAPAAKFRLNVCSGFYVRSFAHDLGIVCSSRSHMASLDRTRQADYTVHDASKLPDLTPTLTYAELEAGEHIWEATLRPQLEAWVAAHPVATGHVNGRNEHLRRKVAEEKEGRPRQRFRGEWLAETKRERIKQQGGKYKGKWGRKNAASSNLTRAIDSQEEVIPAS
ncbi:tRNA pseudouridine synthase B [Paraphoma chrysanthemicola]|nr:tRNA pseudouridine synthase B [Paraphoma chrysanthemicola]